MNTHANTSGALVIFESADHPVQVRLAGETIWLPSARWRRCFATTPENVLMHLKNIYAEGELQELATAKEFLVVQTEGKRQVQRRLKHYNLDATVNSTRATRFRQWATRCCASI
jgi:hypothetical protein